MMIIISIFRRIMYLARMPVFETLHLFYPLAFDLYIFLKAIRVVCHNFCRAITNFHLVHYVCCIHTGNNISNFFFIFSKQRCFYGEEIDVDPTSNAVISHMFIYCITYDSLGRYLSWLGRVDSVRTQTVVLNQSSAL